MPDEPLDEQPAQATRMLDVPDDLDSNETSSASRPEKSKVADRDAAVFESHLVGLEALSGSAQGRTYPLHKKQLYVIGRAPGLDVTIPDQAVSRRHCQLTWVRDRLWMEDLASSNGTTLNGENAERAALQDGDVLQIGETELLVTVLSADHPALQEATPIAPETVPEPTQVMDNPDAGPALEQSLSGMRSALRDVERALIESFRNTSDAERLFKSWSKAVRDSEHRAEEALRARERLEDDLRRVQGQTRALERMLSGDQVALSEELNRLRGEIGERDDNLDEAAVRIRTLEREVSTLHVELDRQRRALAIAQAALDDEKKRRK